VVDYEDLLASLQELLEASSAMTSGQLPTASQLESLPACSGVGAATP